MVIQQLDDLVGMLFFPTSSRLSTDLDGLFVGFRRSEIPVVAIQRTLARAMQELDPRLERNARVFYTLVR